MKNFTALSIAMAAPFILSACSGGDPVTVPRDVLSQQLPVADDASDTIANLLSADEGSNKFVVSQRIIDLDFDNNTVSLPEGAPGQVEVTFDRDNNTIILQIEEDTITFGADDFVEEDNAYHVQLNGEDYYLWSSGGSFADYESGDSPLEHAIILGSYEALNDGDVFGRIIVGYETPQAALDSKALATYTGWSAIDVRNVNNPHNDDARVALEGELVLNVDFTAGTIDGAVTSMLATPRSTGVEAGINDTLAINQTNIIGSQFATDFTHVCAGDCFIDALNSSTVDGTFFGDQGQEVAGPVSLDITTTDGANHVGVGYISGRER